MKYLYPPTLLFICFLWASAGIQSVFGQQIPFFSVYGALPAYINPAAQGGGQSGSVGIVYRSQFTDLPKNERPLTYMLHADVSPLLSALSDRIGLGVMVMQDKVHVAKRLAANGFFAYHLFPQENSFHLGLGVTAGIINQHFDFNNTRISNPNDLVLLRGNDSKTRFDGGLGVKAEYVQENKSKLMFDATLPQLFTSDLKFNEDTSGRYVRYDLLPHALVSLRYRWQGEGIGFEPGLVYRESFGKSLKKGQFDFGLRAYFLENDMFMAGIGYRLNEGGLLVSVGARPIPQLNITAAYENHSALGSTFELGLQYVLGGGACSPGEEETAMMDHVSKTADARKFAATLSATLREKIGLINTTLKEAQNTNNYQIRQTKLETADRMIVQTAELQAKLRAELQKTIQSQERAEDLARQAQANRHKICNENLLVQIKNDYNEIRVLETGIATSLSETKINRAAILPLLNVNDPTSLQSYIAGELKNINPKPDELKVVRVTYTAIEFEFADADEVYVNPSVKAFTEFLVRLADDMKKQNAVIESGRVVEEILYEKVDTRVDAKYKGEYGDPLKLNYKLNYRDRNITLKKDAALNLETLSALKMNEFRRIFCTQTGLPEDKIQISITAPNKNNEYNIVTKLTLNYKKN